MTKKGLLTAAFGIAAAGAACIISPLAAGIGGGVSLLGLGIGAVLRRREKGKYRKDFERATDYRPCYTSRGLTEGEKALVKSIFGNKIKTDNVRLFFSRHTFSDIEAETYGNRILFYGAETHEQDYSRAKNSDNYGLFVHEMTHVFQMQRPLRTRLRKKFFTSRYDYKLRKRRLPQIIPAFQLAGLEQQAELTADYARIFYRNGYERERLPELAEIVERQFPQARKTRLARD